MAEQTEVKQIDDDAISLTSTVESVYDPDKEFIVTQILAERSRAGKKEFLIEWDGYPLEKANWEPKEHIDPGVLGAWATRRKSEKKGIHPPFDVAAWQASQLRFELERQDRKKRRKAKRKRLGISVPGSDGDTNMAEEADKDDSSDDEAMEENEVEDIPTPKSSKRKAESPRKPAKKPVRIRVQGSSIQKLDSSPPGSVTNSPRRKPSSKISGVINAVPQKRDSEKSKAAKPVKKERRSSSASSSDEPLIQRKRQKRLSPEETVMEKTDARRPDLARANSGRSDNVPMVTSSSRNSLTHERPASSSSTASLAEKRSESGAAPEVPSMTGNPSPSVSSDLSQLSMDEDPPAEAEKRPRGRPPTRGRSATRGGSTALRTNVFQSMSSTSTRGRKPGTNLHKLAMDQSKNPKIVSNMHLRRKLELQARDMAEAAPDVSALGGLFNPADMSTVSPVRPSTLRKSSSTLLNAQEQKDLGEEADIDYLFEEKKSEQAPSKLPTPTVSRQPDGPRTCFYWDKQQKGSSNQGCINGYKCDYRHEYRAGLPIAPPPAGYIDNYNPAKRSVCFFWDRAQRDNGNSGCDKGSDCTYLHEYRLGSPVAQPPHGWIEPLSKATSSAAQKQTERADEQAPASATTPPWRKNPLPDSSNQFSLQQEQRPEPFIENAVDITHPMLPPLSANSTTTAVSQTGPVSIFRAQSAGDSTGQPQEPVRPPWDPHHPFNGICYFWWTNDRQCSRGDTCRNYHSNDIRLPIVPSISEQNTIRARTPCKQWTIYGRCDYSPKCMFLHERSPAVPEMASRTSVSLSDAVCDRREDTSASSVPAEPRKKVVKFLLDEKEDVFAEPEAMSPKDRPSRQAGKSKPRFRYEQRFRFRNDKFCTYWREGTCKYGDSCNNIHGYGDVDERDRFDEPRDVEMSDNVELRHQDRRRDIDMLDRPGLPLQDGRRDMQMMDRFELPNRNEAPSHFSEEPLLMPRIETPTVQPFQAALATKPQIPTIAADDVLVTSILNTVTTDAVVKQTSATKLPRKKVSVAEYQRKQALKKLGPRAKLVFFGSDELQPVNLDFGDVQHAEESPWKRTFASIDKVTFSHMCMAKDFESQQGYLQRRGIFAGSLVAAEVENQEIIQIIKQVGDELVLRSVGLLACFPQFSILLFPASKEEWKFLETSWNYPKEGRLKYFVFESDLTLDQPRNHDSSGLKLGKSYRRLMINMIHGLEVKDLLPKVEKNQNPYKFYLLFPSVAKDTSTFLATWIKDYHAQAKVYDSQKEGSWDFFRNNSDAGAVLIHETAAASVHCLPHLFDALTKKSFVFWSVSDNDGILPLFPSWQYESLGESMGRISTTRLFPQGGAVLLTPSFLVAEPTRAYEFLRTFRKKVEQSVPGTWKLVCAFNISQYTLDLALSKVIEKDAFEVEHRDDPAKDAKLVDLGLSFQHCETRNRLHSFFVSLDSQGLLESPIGSDESDSEYNFHEERESWVVATDRFIDPDDEPALIQWFAGWSMRNLDVFRKFIVIGTGASSARRAKRMKEFVVSSEVDHVKILDDTTILNEFSSGDPQSKIRPFSFPLSKTKNSSQPDIRKLSVAKNAALNIAAKLTALAPAKGSVTPSRTAQGSSAIESSPLANQNQAREAARHEVESPLAESQRAFCLATGGSPQDAGIFLDRAQNNVESAIYLYRQENEGAMDLDAQISQLIASATSNQGSLPDTTGASESVRAGQLYGPSSTSKQNNASASPAGSARLPQYDGSSDARSPQFDGVDGRRPSSSGSNSTTRSGIVTSENGRRYVPTSLRADNSVRKEIAIRPNFVPFEDVERYISPGVAASRGISRTASLRSSPAPMANSPRAPAGQASNANLTDLDTPVDGGSVAGTDGGLATKKTKKAEVKKEVKQYTFEDTASWYDRYKKTNGGGWEHIFVGSYEEAIKKSGLSK